MSKFYLTESGKKIELTDEMIALRDRLAVGLGFVKREPCSLHDPGDPESGGRFACWEKVALTYEHRGRMVSPYHAVASDSKWGLQWPEDVMKAAKAIDKGKPPKKTKEKTEKDRALDAFAARRPVTP